MKALVARLTGKRSTNDPINLHITVFWATIAFWLIAVGCFAITRLVS